MVVCVLGDLAVDHLLEGDVRVWAHVNNHEGVPQN